MRPTFSTHPTWHIAKLDAASSVDHGLTEDGSPGRQLLELVPLSTPYTTPGTPTATSASSSCMSSRILLSSELTPSLVLTCLHLGLSCDSEMQRWRTETATNFSLNCFNFFAEPVSNSVSKEVVVKN